MRLFSILWFSLLLFPFFAQSKEEIKLELKKYTQHLTSEQRQEFFAKLQALSPEQRARFLQKFYQRVTQETGDSQELLSSLELLVHELREDPNLQRLLEGVSDFYEMPTEERRAFLQQTLQEGSEQLELLLESAEEHLEEHLESAKHKLDHRIFKLAATSKKYLQQQQEYSQNLKTFWNLSAEEQNELLQLSPQERHHALKQRRNLKTSALPSSSSLALVNHDLSSLDDSPSPTRRHFKNRHSPLRKRLLDRRAHRLGKGGCSQGRCPMMPPHRPMMKRLLDRRAHRLGKGGCSQGRCPMMRKAPGHHRFHGRPSHGGRRPHGRPSHAGFHGRRPHGDFHGERPKAVAS
jgi:hypothetical protein